MQKQLIFVALDLDDIISSEEIIMFHDFLETAVPH